MTHPTALPHLASSTRGDRGLSDSVQWALLVPVVLLALLGAIQTGIVLHARSVVDNAALTGAEIASVGGSAEAARLAARELAGEAGLRNIDVQVSTASGLVTVKVSASAQVILDIGRSSDVGASAVMPAELP
ncbi:MAG TPA: TadE/TadG family type IV pilus assembly protein [Propionibacteriaceae bacterium]|nr:TadE/TadG family type IV pilus assembly protein [Propionibacteriaceae bacterium]